MIQRPERAAFRSSIEVLREALQDVPDSNFEPCRYKLVIDETQDWRIRSRFAPETEL